MNAGAAHPLKPEVLLLPLPTATCCAQAIAASIAVVQTASTFTITLVLPPLQQLPPVSPRSPVCLETGLTTDAGCKLL